jgi:hypothetical protein
MATHTARAMVVGTVDSEMGHYPVCFIVHLILDRDLGVEETVSYDLDQLSHDSGTTRLLEIAQTSLASVVESPFGVKSPSATFRLPQATNLFQKCCTTILVVASADICLSPLGLITSMGWYSHGYETTPSMKELVNLGSSYCAFPLGEPFDLLSPASDRPGPD